MGDKIAYIVFDRALQHEHEKGRQDPEAEQLAEHILHARYGKLNEVMEFRGRKLTFFSGPEGITLELSQKL